MRDGPGTVSETGPLARPRAGFARFELRGRRSTFARPSIDFVAGAALSQGAGFCLCELGDSKMQKTLALCVNSAPCKVHFRSWGSNSQLLSTKVVLLQL